METASWFSVDFLRQEFLCVTLAILGHVDKAGLELNRDLPTCASLVLGLKACTNRHGYAEWLLHNKVLVPAFKRLFGVKSLCAYHPYACGTEVFNMCAHKNPGVLLPHFLTWAESVA